MNVVCRSTVCGTPITRWLDVIKPGHLVRDGLLKSRNERSEEKVDLFKMSLEWSYDSQPKIF